MFLNAARRPCRAAPKRVARGFTLIEILVTTVILLIGLLGVVGLQARAAVVEFESYQRGQALTLAREMASRVSGSRGIVTGFLDASLSSTDGSVFVGEGSDAKSLVDGAGNCVTGAAELDKAKFEMCQWALALQGAAQKDTSAGRNAGAMVGARGCLLQVVPATDSAVADFYVVVVWQGSAPGPEPLGMKAGEAASPASQCASDTNFGAGLRRGVSVRVLVPDLAKAV